MRVIFKDYQLNDDYIYHGEVVDSPIVAMSGTEDKTVDSRNMYEWSHMTNRGFKQHSFPGDHFYLYNKSVKAFLDMIHREICSSEEVPAAS